MHRDREQAGSAGQQELAHAAEPAGDRVHPTTRHAAEPGAGSGGRRGASHLSYHAEQSRRRRAALTGYWRPAKRPPQRAQERGRPVYRYASGDAGHRRPSLYGASRTITMRHAAAREQYSAPYRPVTPTEGIANQLTEANFSPLPLTAESAQQDPLFPPVAHGLDAERVCHALPSHHQRAWDRRTSWPGQW